MLWVLMILGGLIGSGFVMAQQSQINVHHLKRAEEQVKTQLDELTNQQRYLALEKERAINTQESERIAKQSGLMQPKLERVVIQRPPIEPSERPAAAKQVAKPASKPSAKSVAKPVIKPAAQLKQFAKQPPVKPVVKMGKAVPGKAGKDGKNRQQLAEKQDVKREKRR